MEVMLNFNFISWHWHSISVVWMVFESNRLKCKIQRETTA